MSSRFWTSRFSRSASSSDRSRAARWRVCGSRAARRSSSRVLAAPGDGGQRRAEVVRDRAEQRVAEALGLDAGPGPRGPRRRAAPARWPGRSGWRRSRAAGAARRVQGMAGRRAARRARPPVRARRSAAGTGPTRRAAWRCRGRRAGVLEDPLGHADSLASSSNCRAGCRGAASRPSGVGQQHDDLALEDVADVPHGDRQQLVHARRARQLAAQRVERRRPPLALAGGLGLGPDADR